MFSILYWFDNFIDSIVFWIINGFYDTFFNMDFSYLAFNVLDSRKAFIFRVSKQTSFYKGSISFIVFPLIFSVCLLLSYPSLFTSYLLTFYKFISRILFSNIFTLYFRESFSSVSLPISLAMILLCYLLRNSSCLVSCVYCYVSTMRVLIICWRSTVRLW